ncbi:hypothetical protein BAR24_01715 [Gluconobacter oxydans]|uniref:hypothetical protein n=1 Tax=Gluconobacter thailandicus TaxID=257438 RepID=UPI0002999A58|nr:hypothetical protein [Gluconobacter thailandicus]AFW01068.1 hypothetical protein B932_1489 [Gluconobacter oxydans H24]ANQ40291.1 hypothetical protein BAR24_01715 [Gluconobacter oxydans]GAN91449.1 hypothetical protein Gbfr_037_044 [Gluconobacter frateurii M-2]
MSFEMLPGLHDIVHRWVVKKDTSLMPQRLSEEDINALAKASIETLKQRALGDLTLEWGSLQELTSSWIVQRERGQIPFSLTTEEFRSFIKLALEGFLTPVRIPLESQDISETILETRPEAEALDVDAFRFAREHLARCL